MVSTLSLSVSGIKQELYKTPSILLNYEKLNREEEKRVSSPFSLFGESSCRRRPPLPKKKKQKI